MAVLDRLESTFLDNVQLLLSLRSQHSLQRLFRKREERSIEEMVASRLQFSLLYLLGGSITRTTPSPQLGDAVMISLEGMESVSIRRHYSRGFPVYDDNIAPLFLLLSPRHILSILQTILLEGKIVLHSSYPGLITNVAHILKRLLFPWKYAGSFIPLLPSSMLLAVQVPGSFIIGVETVSGVWSE